MRPRPRTGSGEVTRAAWRGLSGWAAIGGLAVLLAACARSGNGALPQNALDPAGPIARAQDHLWNIVFPVAVAVFILVQGLIIVAVVKFRDRGESQPPKQVHGNTRLELVWTIIPTLILVGIAVPTISTIFQLSGPAASDALKVRVIGKQYWWQFEYLNADTPKPIRTASELHIPTGREVFIELDGQSKDDGADVIHSFWVPRLAGKQDYVPGHMRTMRIQADNPGTYPGQCAEFCGLSHADMRFTVIAHAPAEFDRWLANQSKAAALPTAALARQGMELVAGQGCLGCHTIEGHPQNADARVGPNLTHFAVQAKFAGYTYPRTDQNLKEWISDPQALKMGAQMPDWGGGSPLSQQQLNALVAYLQSLR
ncbi:MAG: cytochrome c oxidase subunit II [Egibacteraceae bacterium]